MNPRLALFIRILLLVPMCACAASPSPKAVVASAQASLTAAGRTIIVCYSVPACASVAPKDQIRAEFMAAYHALTAAQAVADAGAVPQMDVATVSIARLNTTLATLPSQGE